MKKRRPVPKGTGPPARGRVTDQTLRLGPLGGGHHYGFNIVDAGGIRQAALRNNTTIGCILRKNTGLGQKGAAYGMSCGDTHQSRASSSASNASGNDARATGTSRINKAS